jgi:hypothetical protein
MIKLASVVIIAAISQLFTCNKNTSQKNVSCDISLSQGLIAYYPFNGNANDESGHNKHGQLMNGTSFSTDAGNNGNKAAYFDGIDDWIKIVDNNHYFSPDKMSVSFQLNLRDAGKRNNIFTKSAFNEPKANTWGAFVTDKLTLRIPGPKDCSELWSDNDDFDLQAEEEIRDNRWYHITLIFNEGLEMIYLNGKLQTARVNDFKTMNKCKSTDLKIGGWWQNDVISMHGKVDEIRIYDRILSENEINYLAKEIK